jgi:hypothetical protein
MMDVIREGGWPMFPVIAFGLVALALSLRHALFPARHQLPLAVGFIVATVIMGVLGTALGMQTSARGIPDAPPDMRWIFVVGLRESLNNVGAALFLALPSVLAAAAGASRLARRLDEVATAK